MNIHKLGMRLKRTLSALLSAAMIVSGMYVPAYAENSGAKSTIITEETGVGAEDVIKASEVKAAGYEDAVELLTNGDFSGGIDSWELVNTGNVLDTEWNPPALGDWGATDGGKNYSMKFKANGDVVVYSKTPVDLTAGKYQMSAYAYEYDGDNLFTLNLELVKNPEDFAYSSENAVELGATASFSLKESEIEIASDDSYYAGVIIHAAGISSWPDFKLGTVSLIGPKDETEEFSRDTLVSLLDGNISVEDADGDDITVVDIRTNVEADSNYYEATVYAAYIIALEAATEAAANEALSSDEYEIAYDNLVSAMGDLYRTPAAVEIFYMYSDAELEEGDFLVAETWGSSAFEAVNEIVSYKETDGTYTWDAEGYKLTKLYGNWYYLELSKRPDGAKEADGFNVYVCNESTGVNSSTGVVYQFDDWNNTEVYDAIRAAEEYEYVAFDSESVYTESAALHIPYQATMYIDGGLVAAGKVPALYQWTGNSGYPLKRVEEGELISLTPDYSEGENAFYLPEDASEDIADGWYKITFSLYPETGEIFQLVGVDADGTNCDWDPSTKFRLDGESGEDLNEILAGKIYYTEAGFTDSLDATLLMLRTLAASATAYAQEDYTEESWNTFKTALEGVQTLLENDSYKDKTDDEAALITGDDIQSAYDELSEAIDSLEEIVLFNTVNLYYYDEVNDLTSLKIKSWAAGKCINDSENFVLAEDAGDNWYKTEIQILEAAGSQSGDDGFEINNDSWGNKIAAFSNTGNSWDTNAEIYDAIVAKGDGESIYIKNFKAYDSVEDAETVSLFMLRELVAEAAALQEEKYEAAGWPAFAAALDTAKELINGAAYKDKTEEEAQEIADDDLKAAYKELSSAMSSLVKIITGKDINLYYYSDDTDLTELRVMAYGGKTCIKDSDNFVKATDAGENWYKTVITVMSEAGNESEDDGFNICDSDWGNVFIQIAHQTGWSSNPELYDAIIAKEDGENIYIKNYKAYDSIDDTESVSLAELKELVSEAEAYREEDYTEDTYKAVKTALISANAIIEAVEIEGEPESEYADDIEMVYEALKAAIEALVAKENPHINVKPVSLSEDFITGADISSYISIRDSGVTFKDENGRVLTDDEFFKYLKEGGTNWIRIRVWNDPYDSSGNGYGGGNNDIEKAVQLGKLAQKAGMKILMDFHYSDFWADPSKYKVPKAWANYTNAQKADAVYEFTYDSLERLYNEGVTNIYMVQVGNESNHGLAGETDGDATKLYGYGCDAVHDAADKLFGHYIDAAIHLTDVQAGGSTVTGGLSRQVVNNTYTDRNGSTHYVNYDAVGVSYYPLYRHDDTHNLYSVLNTLKNGYGPGGTKTKVFVAETAWTTTWADGDGFSNSGPSLIGQDTDLYSISVQGQADELRDVVNTVNSIGDQGFGVFYWEPAWLAPYQACYDDYSVDEELYKKNQAAWEKYGSGWASSFSYEYDPTDAGLYYGGVGVDNQSWFDFSGKALPTAKIYSLIRKGAINQDKAELISIDENQLITLRVGADLEKELEGVSVKGLINNGEKITLENVKWDKDDIEAIDTDKADTYVVFGEATAPAIYGGKTYQVRVTIEITANFNSILSNADFESIKNATSNNCQFYDWEVYAVNEDGSFITYPDFKWGTNNITINDENPRGASKHALNFWHAEKPLEVHVYQEVGSLEKGSYTFGGYIEGGSAGEYDQQYAVAYVYENEAAFKADMEATKANPQEHPIGTDAKRKYKDSKQFAGWLSWMNPEAKNIIVNDSSEYVIVGFEFNGTPAGAWGSVDDAYMYGNYDIAVQDTEHGKLSVSNPRPGTNQLVKVTARADKGYVIDSVSVNGVGLSEYFDSEWQISADGKTAVWKPSEDQADMTSALVSFRMPKTVISVGAVFKDVFAEGDVDIAKVEVKSIGGVSYNDGTAKFYTRNGERVQPELVLTYKGYVLGKGDYKLKYTNSTAAGTAGITVTGNGKFMGTKELSYVLVSDERISIADAEIIWEGAYKAAGKSVEYFYTGKKVEPQISLSINGVAVPRESYVVSYYKNEKVGTAQYFITAKGSSYGGSLSGKFKIVKADLSVLVSPTDAEYTPIVINGNNTLADVDYVKGGARPAVNIWYGTVNLRKNKDFKITFKNTNKISKAGEKLSTATIKGCGNYTGKYVISFAVNPKSISDSDIYMTAEDMLQGNGAKKPVIKAFYTANSKNKIATNEYSVTSVSCMDGTVLEQAMVPVDKAGIYKVTVTGKNHYKGTRVIDVRVIDKEHYFTKSSVKFGNVFYQGKAITVKNGGLTIVTATDGKLPANALCIMTAAGKKAIPAKNIEVYKYENNVSAGQATMWLRAVGTDDEGKPYGGNTMVTFNIKKLKLVNQDKYEQLVNKSTPENNAAMGYATIAGDLKYIQAHMKEDTTFGVEQYYTGYKLTPEYELSVSVNGVEGINPFSVEKDYHSQFKNNTKPSVTATDGTIYGSEIYVPGTGVGGMFKGTGNYTGAVKVSDLFFIHPRTVDDLDVVIDNAAFNKTKGEAEIIFTDIRYGVRVFPKKSIAYSVKYKLHKFAMGIYKVLGIENELAPEIVVTIKGDLKSKDSSKNTIKKKFNINTAKLSVTSVKDIKPQSYKGGKAVMPKLTVVVDGKVLVPDKDYVVTYINNYERYSTDDLKDERAPRAIVTGVGNYSGTVEKVFTIK